MNEAMIERGILILVGVGLALVVFLGIVLTLLYRVLTKDEGVKESAEIIDEEVRYLRERLKAADEERNRLIETILTLRASGEGVSRLDLAMSKDDRWGRYTTEQIEDETMARERDSVEEELKRQINADL